VTFAYVDRRRDHHSHKHLGTDGNSKKVCAKWAETVPYGLIFLKKSQTTAFLERGSSAKHDCTT
jgi:hypothetical protein